MNDLKTNSFFLVMCKTRRKFDRYVKVNKIKNKIIIDISKLCEEEELEIDDISKSDVFKIILLKKFNLAKHKKKDIYYIPDFSVDDQINKVFNIKKLFEDTHNFNLLCIYSDFNDVETPNQILDKIEEFDYSQILKNY